MPKDLSMSYTFLYSSSNKCDVIKKIKDLLREVARLPYFDIVLRDMFVISVLKLIYENCPPDMLGIDSDEDGSYLLNNIIIHCSSDWPDENLIGQSLFLRTMQ